MNRETARKLVDLLTIHQRIELSGMLPGPSIFPTTDLLRGETIDESLIPRLAHQEEIDAIIIKRMTHRRKFLQEKVDKLEVLCSIWHGKYAIVCMENNALRRRARGFNRRAEIQEDVKNG